MNNNAIVERIISKERLDPYINYHKNDLLKAISHYKSNILISESFYPLLAVLEIGLRNSIDYQLTKRFNDREWYDNKDFVKMQPDSKLIEYRKQGQISIQKKRK